MSLGPMELVVILGIALLFFGPSRLPGLGRSLGDAIRGFKKGLDGSDDTRPAGSSEQLNDGSRTAEKQSEKDKTRS